MNRTIKIVALVILIGGLTVALPASAMAKSEIVPGGKSGPDAARGVALPPEVDAAPPPPDAGLPKGGVLL